MTDPGPQPFPTLGPDWLPWNLPSDAGNQAAQGATQLLGGGRAIVLQILAAAAGAGLVVVGLVLLAKPGLDSYTAKAAPMVGGGSE